MKIEKNTRNTASTIHAAKISYTIREATAASGLGRTSIYKLIKQGELKPVKVGSRTLIRRTDLEEMLERKAAA